MKASSILGLNARTKLYSYRYNKVHGRRIARSKLLTKKYLKRAGVPIPAMLAKFKEPQDIFDFDWTSLPDSFALKPNKGLGGAGIVVAKRRDKEDKTRWISVKRERITIDDLKLHALDILEGAFSVDNSPDVAYIEEYVGRHKSLAKFAYRGTPDIRVIVFNKVPVMAMLRLPTRESGGRANLHQGAIGVGVDIATGITTSAIWHGDFIKYKPGSKKRKLNGIKIPYWDEVLQTAVRCQEATQLGYVGVDVVLHPERGPMVLEVNSQPGLQIQLCNKAGLNKRLARVDDLEVPSNDHGVRIAKALFGEKFSLKVKSKDKQPVLKSAEEVILVDGSGKKIKVMAKIDTGAWSSSIDRDFAQELGLLKRDKILWYRKKANALGTEQRPVISLKFWLAGKKISTVVSTAKRTHLTYKMLVGRTDLTGFLIDPYIDPKTKAKAKKW